MGHHTASPLPAQAEHASQPPLPHSADGTPVRHGNSDAQAAKTMAPQPSVTLSAVDGARGWQMTKVTFMCLKGRLCDAAQQMPGCHDQST